MSEPDYKAKVLEVWPDAELEYEYNEMKGIMWAVYSEQAGYLSNHAGRKNVAWRNAYEQLKQQGKI